MTFKHLKSRRDFLRLGARSISTLGAAAAFGQAGLLTAQTAPAGDYKALVCVFLFGGNDSNNMLIPADTPTYTTYKSIRGNLALPQASLVTLPGTNFGLHPSMSALQKYFQKDPATNTTRLALLANVGTLVNTVTRASNGNLNGALPSNLFSHSDQQTEWQNANPGAKSGVVGGWSGRLADKVATLQSFPPSIGVSGGALQLVGVQTQPTTAGTTGFSLLTGLTDPRTAALQQMQSLSLSSGVTLVQAVGSSLKSAIDVATTIDNAVKSAGSALAPFPNTDIGTQLQQVAQIIQIRKALGVTRQIFFVSQGGFDTHSNQLPQQVTPPTASWAQAKSPDTFTRVMPESPCTTLGLALRAIEPQQLTAPEECTTQVERKPADTSRASVIPGTNAGRGSPNDSVPRPIWAVSFPPQHCTRPRRSR